MPSIPCMCFQVTPLSMTPWYLSLHLPNHVTSAPALVPVTHGVPALSFLRPQLSPLGKEFEEPRKDSPSVHSSPSRQCSEYLGRQKSLPTQPQRSSFQPQCGLLPRRWMVAKKGPLSGCKWSHDMPTTLAMQVHGRPWVVQNRVPAGGWETPCILFFWAPQRTGGSLFSVLLTPGTCRCQASLGSGRSRTTSSAVSSRCSLGSCFSNSALCRDDLSPFQAYSRPHSQSQTQWVWHGAPKFTFLPNSGALLLLLVLRPPSQ